jgi:hypothetical protein
MPHWKLLLLPLAVIVPLTAYLAGAVADGPDGPVRPEPIVLQDTAGSSDDRRDGQDDGRPGKERTGDPAREDDGDDHGGDRRDDSDDDRDDDDDGSDDRVEVVVPEPTQVDDGPEGDDDDDRDETDDHGDDGDDGDDD